MRMRNTCHMRGVLCIFTALVFVMGATHSASAQWTTGNAAAAWTSFNNHFYNLDPNDHTKAYYYHQEGSTAEEGFWTFAEEIEMAIDAEVWDKTNAPGNVTTDKNRVVALANGFRQQHGECCSGTPTWTSDPYNDDLGVAELAFVRCWEISSNSSCLTDAENSFNAVYTRGWDSTYGGGLWWNNTRTGSGALKGSSANWTAVIAGILLYQATGDSSYKTKADTIYNWCKSTLEDTSTGQVYNDIEASGLNKGIVSYNFGLAIGAAYLEGDTTNSNLMGTYLINNVQDSTRAQVNGYNILPNYGQANNGFGAFNAITFRWTAIANRAPGGMPSNFVAWAQQNLDLGWADRNPEALTWDDWIPDPPASTSPITPSTGLQSTDCTPFVTGAMYIPPPA